MKKSIRLTDNDRIEIRLALELIGECAEELRDGDGPHERTDLANAICSQVDFVRSRIWDVLDLGNIPNNCIPSDDYEFDHEGNLVILG